MAETYIMHRFDSIHEFVKASERGASKSDASHKERGDWAGTDSFAQAVDFAKNGGWQPGDLLEFRDIFDGLEARLRKFKSDEWERGMDQGGFEVNMQAYMDGEPEHMFEWLPAEHQVTRRAVCIIIGHSVSAGCTAKDLFIRGQAAVALVRALALLGYELEIWSEETVSGGWGSQDNKKLPDYFTTLVKLHGAGEVMDESAVEFAIGNPSWLRRLLFGFQEGQPQDVRRKFGFGSMMGGYGSITPIKHAEMVGADVELNLGETWFNTYGGRERTAEDGMVWVMDQLKRLGVVDQEAEWDGE